VAERSGNACTSERRIKNRFARLVEHRRGGWRVGQRRFG
jgi:hypothetical protein